MDFPLNVELNTYDKCLYRAPTCSLTWMHTDSAHRRVGRGTVSGTYSAYYGAHDT